MQGYLRAERARALTPKRGRFSATCVSGAKTDRAQLRRLLDQLEADDVVMVTRLDRVARSTRDLLNILATITGKKAGFKSLGDTWADTTTSHGRLMLTVLGGLAEFERDLIRARTGEGRERAKARGVKMGRKPKVAPHPAGRGDQAPRGGRTNPRDRPHLQRRITGGAAPAVRDPQHWRLSADSSHSSSPPLSTGA
jgi:DNA invertase Pin-like site-specific DNA recombinase